MTVRVFHWHSGLTSALVVVIATAIALLTAATVGNVRGPLVLVPQVVLLATFFALAFRDLRVAVAIAMLELAIAGAGGQWTRLPGGLSGRVALDMIVTLAAASVLLRQWRATGDLSLGRYGAHAIVLALVIPATWMGLGLLNGNEPRDVIADGNGHLFFAFTLAFVALMAQGHAAWLRHWFFAVCVINAVFTLALVVLSVPGIVALEPTLRYILSDQLLVGNVIGYQPNGAYRLFLASGLYLQLGLALTVWRLLERPGSWAYWALFGVFSIDIAATYTRGFWIGALLAFIIVLVIGSGTVRRAATIVGGAVAAIAIGTLVGLPFQFSVPDYLLQRTASIGAMGGIEESPSAPVGSPAAPEPERPSEQHDPEQDLAGRVSNEIRIEQARVLLRHIAERPALGHGFGAISEDYEYGETFSYELAYLDLLYKTGVIGFLLFMSYPIRLLVDAGRGCLGRLALPTRVERREMAVVIAIVGSVMLTGATNPYFLAAFGLMPILAMIAWLDPLGPRRGACPVDHRDG